MFAVRGFGAELGGCGFCARPPFPQEKRMRDRGRGVWQGRGACPSGCDWHWDLRPRWKGEEGCETECPPLAAPRLHPLSPRLLS